MSDFTDYHRFSWSVVKPPTPRLRTFFYRLPGYLVLLTIIHFTYTARFFKEMDTGARIFVFCLVTLITFGLIIIFDRVLNQIEKSRGPQLLNYRIDKQGVHVNNRRYPHTTTTALHFPNDAVRQKALTTIKYYQK